MLALIAEDSSITRLIERKVIESLGMGFQIHEAEDGTDALRILRQWQKCELLILDLDMPRQNGIEVLQSLWQNPLAGGNPKVIIVSAMADSPTVQRTKELGVHHFVIKPFTKAILASKIKTLFA